MVFFVIWVSNRYNKMLIVFASNHQMLCPWCPYWTYWTYWHPYWIVKHLIINQLLAKRPSRKFPWFRGAFAAVWGKAADSWAGLRQGETCRKSVDFLWLPHSAFSCESCCFPEFHFSRRHQSFSSWFCLSFYFSLRIWVFAAVVPFP